jgi:hypothetical protein
MLFANPEFKHLEMEEIFVEGQIDEINPATGNKKVPIESDGRQSVMFSTM